MKNKIIIFIFSFFVINIIVLLFLVRFFNKNADNCEIAECQYEKYQKEIYDRIIESGACEIIDSDRPQHSVSGVIEDINGAKIYVRIKPMSPLDDLDLDVRIVDTAEAPIIKQVSKNNEIFLKEMEEYRLNNPVNYDEDEFLSNAPKSYIEKIINTNELNIGEKIYIETQNNIRNNKEFKAGKVFVIN